MCLPGCLLGVCARGACGVYFAECVLGVWWGGGAPGLCFADFLPPLSAQGAVCGLAAPRRVNLGPPSHLGCVPFWGKVLPAAPPPPPPPVWGGGIRLQMIFFC